MRDAAESVRGNARVCLFVEPLFSIPHAMYIGYMTLYMLELGLTKSQVGMISSLGMAISIFFALSSAYITDRFGRRRTTFIFDTFGWVGAQLVWALARNFYFFVAGVIINSFFRVILNSWNCLALEDSHPDERVHFFPFMQIVSILGGFFAPVGAFLINRMTLIPAMRVMLVFSLVSMLTQNIIRHLSVTETAIGKQKMQEMKDVRIWEAFAAYIPVLKRIVKDRLLVIVVFIRSLNSIQMIVRSTFLAVLVTERLGFPPETMAMVHTINSLIMLVSLLFITPMLSQFTSRWPIALGIGLHIASTVILLLSPASQSYFVLIVSAILIALGSSISSPRIEAIVANTISNEDRSLVNSVMQVLSVAISAPFGFVGGVLSGIDTRLPFLLTLCILFGCLLLLRVATAVEKKMTM